LILERKVRNQGTSAVVLSYNEPECIVLFSLKSISDPVDEILVFDSSNDETTRIIEELSSSLPGKYEVNSEAMYSLLAFSGHFKLNVTIGSPNLFLPSLGL